MLMENRILVVGKAFAHSSIAIENVHQYFPSVEALYSLLAAGKRYIAHIA